MIKIGASLLVLTSFTKSEWNPVWAQLQPQFLKKTTRFYRYVVFSNGEKEHLPEADDLVVSDEPQMYGSGHHARILHSMIDYCRSSHYDEFLILDSDCFPFENGWYNRLQRQIIRNNCDFSAIVRAENINFYPCAAAIYFNRQSLNQIRFDFGKREVIVGGHACDDTGSRMSLDKCFPMLRTNRVNYHPLYAGIYNDMFYHHGAGSRKPPGFHGNMCYGENYATHEDLFNLLKQDPEGMINRLKKRAVW